MQQQASEILIRQVQQAGWNISVGKKSWMITAPTERKALAFLEDWGADYFSSLAQSWNLDKVCIGYPGNLWAFTIPASFARQDRQLKKLKRKIMKMVTTTDPLIAIPTLEIGALTLSPAILKKAEFMLNNPNLVTGLTRITDESQVVMSASSVKLLTTTTLRQAVQRKRSEYWHPFDLNNFRIQTAEYVRDLINGVISPEDTIQEVPWRCVSGNGSWRLITHRYETFIDETKTAYQFSQNIGVEAIDPPEDLIKICR